jgi:virginiamycin B lyase
MNIRNFMTRRNKKGRALWAVVAVLPPVLLTATAAGPRLAQLPATAAAADLSPQWFQQLRDADPTKWVDQYCSAKLFQSSRLCLVVETAKLLRHGKSPDAVRVDLLTKDQSPSDLSPPNLPVDSGQDRVPDPAKFPAVQPAPGGNNTASSATHIVEHPVPTVSFPIDNKIAPDGADWFSMLTQNGLPGIGRVDPKTKAMSVFSLPQETGITYAVNGGPGPYEWWTSIPFEGFGNKIGRINIYTHEVENWEIPTPYSYPADLKTGPDGAIWFTETRGNKIGRFDPSTKTFAEYDVDTHALTPGPVSGPPTSLPQDVAVIEDKGNPPDYDCKTAPSWDSAPRWKDVYDGGACNASGVWWVNQSPYANSLQRIDPYTREITTYPFKTPGGLSLDISPGKDGRTVWFWFMGARKAGWFDPVTKVMTEFSVPSENFVCCGGAGPDNAMYWSESHYNLVGRYDLSTKEVTTIPVPTRSAYTIDWQILNGSVFFAEFRANSMGEIIPDPRQQLTSWPCGCAAPAGHPWNPSPHARSTYPGPW